MWKKRRSKQKVFGDVGDVTISKGMKISCLCSERQMKSKINKLIEKDKENSSNDFDGMDEVKFICDLPGVIIIWSEVI